MSDLARVALRVLPRKAASTSPQRHPRKTEPGVTEHRRKSSHPAAEIRVPSRALGPQKRPPPGRRHRLPGPDPRPGCGGIGREGHGRGLQRGFGPPPAGSPPPCTANVRHARFPWKRPKKNGRAVCGASSLGATHLQMADPRREIAVPASVSLSSGGSL